MTTGRFSHHFITETELWACTTCNACAMECPININHPSLIVDMRRYLVMEEGSCAGGIEIGIQQYRKQWCTLAILS